MQSFVIYILLIILVSSCHQRVNDSAEVVVRREISGQGSADEFDLDTKKLRQEFVNAYFNQEIIDTSLMTVNNDTLKYRSVYYCLFDSAITIPGKYVYEDTTIAFKTHNFCFDLIICKGIDTIFKKTFVKEDFEMDLPDYLYKYAILFSPNTPIFDRAKNEFIITLSISIPITDVGESRTICISKDGEYRIRRN